MGLKAVIFDFDYTLADSSSGVVKCIRFAFERMQLPPVSAERIRHTIGLSVPDTLVDLAGEELRDRAEEFRALFKERADQVMAANTTIFDTVRPMVGRIKECDMRTGIVSTKFRYRIESLLARDELSHLFDIIIGGEDVEREKPDPTGLSVAVDRLGAPADSTLYVGDSVTDAETAKRAGVPFAAVLTGTTEAEAFSEYNALGILNSLVDLPGLVEGITISSFGEN